jgi:hypothetical protein
MRLHALLLLLALPAAAHEFWLEPSTFRPKPGDQVSVRLFIGDGMPGEAYARNPEKLDAFFVEADGRRFDIEGAPGADPAGAFLAPRGPFVIGYRSRRSRVELDPAQFEAYLAEDGLEEISRLRAAAGKSGEPGREVYSRCAKAVVGGKDRAIGFPYELIVEEEKGGAVTLRALRDGKPLKGALVRAFHPREKAKAVRSDADGRARFELPAAGMWLFGSVHMGPAPAGTDADWESLWASLTLEVAPGPSAG